MTSTRIPALIAGLAIAATLGACSDMTPREHSTAVGAGIGAAAGAVLTGTPQGAAVGAAASAICALCPFATSGLTAKTPAA